MKRTCLWSTGQAIAAFQIYAVVKTKDVTTKKKTVVKYVNRYGETAYKGSKELKSTQFPGSILKYILHLTI